MKKIDSQWKVERRQTGVKLDCKLLRRMKILAVRRDTTLANLLEQAMRRFLDQKLTGDWE
jgi:predicted transcriptional regulator